MNYKKVFSSTRFHTKSQNNFSIDSKNKSVIIGRRPDSEGRTAFIGKIIEQGRASNVLDYGVQCDIAFPHVVGIFGSRGSGKSFDLGVLLEGVFIPEAASGPVREAAIVFDVQDQFWTLAYEPKPTIVDDQSQLADLGRWGLQPNRVANVHVLVPLGSDTQVPGAVHFALSADQLSTADWLAILELERFSAMGQGLITLLADVGAATPSELAQACAAGQALGSFQQGTIDGLQWRLESLATTRIIEPTGLSIDELLRPSRLSVVLMRNLAESIRGLVVGVVSRLVADRMGRIQQARKVALRAPNPSEGPSAELTGRLWLVLDEAHVLVPSDGTTAATGPLIDYVKRGRDAGLSLVFATQQPSAVNSKLMSQVDLSITHMLGFETDLSAAVARMPTRANVEYDVDNQKVSSIADVIRSLGPGEAVVADAASGRAFILKVRPRMTAHGGATPK
ncbi:ATP-binding protein [Mesorhizobium sp. M0933]|uniref:ATP-binding protein n=1 Tax=Mesorhizobium sp. M0933 TaxID=2957030 RepID=UPI00333DB1E3